MNVQAPKAHDTEPSADVHYKVLGLRPGAPRGVVEEVYWHLTQQTRKETNSLRGVERLAALNTAYDRITHAYGQNVAAANGARSDRASRSPAKEHRRLFGRRSSNGVHRDVNHYELLHVDHEAHVEVVHVAASVLLPLAQADRQLHEQIQRAREILANPERRAAYDKKIGLKRAPGSESAQMAAEPTAETRDAVHPNAADSPAAAANVPLPEQATRAHASVTEAQNDISAAAAAQTGSDPGSDAGLMPDGGSAAVPPEGERRARRGFGLASWLSRNEPTPEAIEAENDRVRSLTSKDELWNVTETPPELADVARQDDAALATPSKPARSAFSVTFVRGPREGNEIVLNSGDDTRVDLAGAGGEVQIRIWRSAGVYLLQQLIGPPVLIAGAHIEAPVVVLEDGDVIESGEHVLRFRWA